MVILVVFFLQMCVSGVLNKSWSKAQHDVVIDYSHKTDTVYQSACWGLPWGFISLAQSVGLPAWVLERKCRHKERPYDSCFCLDHKTLRSRHHSSVCYDNYSFFSVFTLVWAGVCVCVHTKMNSSRRSIFVKGLAVFVCSAVTLEFDWLDSILNIDSYLPRLCSGFLS